MIEFSKLKEELNKIKSCRFIRIDNYQTIEGEIQSTTINVGTSYSNAKNRDIEYLSRLDVRKLKSSFSNEILEEAKDLLLFCLKQPNKAKSSAQKNIYRHICNGLKFHEQKNRFYVFGSYIKGTKIVHEKSLVNHEQSELVKAKNFLRENMSTGSYRQYVLSNIECVKINKETIIFDVG